MKGCLEICLAMKLNLGIWGIVDGIDDDNRILFGMRNLMCGEWFSE